MTVLIGDVVRATQEMHYGTHGEIQNVYHLQNITDNLTDEAALEDIIEILEDLAVVLAAVIALAQVVDGVRAINLTQSTDIGFGLFVDDTPYTGAGQITPLQDAVGINLHTGILGVFGRKYFGAIPVGVAGDGGLVESGSLAVLATAGGYMSSRWSATHSQWDMGVVRSKVGFEGDFEYFNAYSLPTTVITQRRRRAGVGI